MVDWGGIGPPTSWLRTKHSTTELPAHASNMKVSPIKRILIPTQPINTQKPTHWEMSNITIANINAQPNSNTHGFLDFGEPEYKIPFVIINGQNKEKTIAVLGGVHGTEYPSIKAVIRLTQKLDPAQLSGTVIAVPLTNIPQFLGHSQFTSPVDGLNLNSEFPGDPEGSLTQRIAHRIFTYIVSKCHALIDCHGGDIDEDINGFVVASSSGNPTLDRISLEMASCYKTGLVHVFPSKEKGCPTAPNASTTSPASSQRQAHHSQSRSKQSNSTSMAY